MEWINQKSKAKLKGSTVIKNLAVHWQKVRPLLTPKPPKALLSGTTFLTGGYTTDRPLMGQLENASLFPIDGGSHINLIFDKQEGQELTWNSLAHSTEGTSRVKKSSSKFLIHCLLSLDLDHHLVRIKRKQDHDDCTQNRLMEVLVG